MSKIIPFNSFREMITVVIPLENTKVDKFDSIKLLVTKNLLNQTIDKKLINLIFLTSNPEEEMNFLITEEYTNTFNSVIVVQTQGPTVPSLDHLVKNIIKTKYYCFRTIGEGNINGVDLPFRVEWLNHHLEKSLELMNKNKSSFLIPIAEFSDVMTYGIKEIPDLIDIRTFDQLLKNIQVISLEEIVFSKQLPEFSFEECVVQNQKIGKVEFVPAVLVSKWLNEKIPTSLTDLAHVRIYIKSDMIRKPLRVIVDNDIIKAV